MIYFIFVIIWSNFATIYILCLMVWYLDLQVWKLYNFGNYLLNILRFVVHIKALWIFHILCDMEFYGKIQIFNKNFLNDDSIYILYGILVNRLLKSKRYINFDFNVCRSQIKYILYDWCAIVALSYYHHCFSPEISTRLMHCLNIHLC